MQRVIENIASLSLTASLLWMSSMALNRACCSSIFHHRFTLENCGAL